MRFIKVIFVVVTTFFCQISFAGEFGDHCTTSLAAGLLSKSDCSNNSILEGKIYCFGTKEAKNAFDQSPNKKQIITKAEDFYKTSQEQVRTKISQEQANQIIKSNKCDLSDKDLGYMTFEKMDLSHCVMKNVSLFGTDLRHANLKGVDLRNSYLNLARLENADLSNTNLTDSVIFQAIFDKTNFENANLTNVRMIGTLGAVNMKGAVIKKGRFGLDMGNQPMGQMKFDSTGGNFMNANFEHADLNIASFLFGDLKGANLRNTNLFRAELSKADLTGADLTGANLTDAIVDGAIMKDVKGLETVKGWETVKGKCEFCKQ